MKKSEIYTKAMLAVIDDDTLTAPQKLEIIDRLLSDRTVAKWNEEQEEKF